MLCDPLGSRWRLFPSAAIMGGQARADTIRRAAPFDLTHAEYLMAQTVIVSWCTVALRARSDCPIPLMCETPARLNVPEQRALHIDQGGDSMGPMRVMYS